MSDVIITVSKLGKKYRLMHQGDTPRYTALRDVIVEKARGLFHRRSAAAMGSPLAEDFWALQDVSFEVKRGEVVGIIGRNGAGKSTLLKVLSRITEPTTGRVHLRGRVASLLEVGTGFHPELTGRENVFLNGAILGMSRAEIRRKFDEIVAFAEVEKFLDTPVKRYSSGMYVRLAFAVAAHLEPEILIVDEVLAVGDVEFQKKCMGKMRDVAGHGRTVLFVSHNTAAITRLCHTGIFMKNGRVISEGTAEAVVADYLRMAGGEKTAYDSEQGGKPLGNELVTLLALTVKDEQGGTGPVFGGGSTLQVEFVYRILQPTRNLRVGFHLHNSDGAIIFNAADTDTPEVAASERAQQPGVYASSCQIPAGFLNRGQFFITAGSDAASVVNFYSENIISFFIEPDGRAGSTADNRPGLICPGLKWKLRSVAPVV